MPGRPNGANPPSGHQDDFYGPPPQGPLPDLTRMTTLGGIVVLLLISFAKPFQEFAKLINAELASKGIAIPAEAGSD